MLLLKFLTTFLLACPTVANPLPDAPAPPLTKRWNSLSCHTNNYKHTASWGWTTGMEGSINLGCGALFGYSGHPRWVAKGGTLVISVPLPTKGYATHIQVSFVARHRGTWIDSKLCKSMLGEVLWRCTIRKKHQDAVGKIHGGYVRTDDGNLAAMMAFFPTCCHRGTDKEYEENWRAKPMPDIRDWD